MIAPSQRHMVAASQRFSPSDPCPICGGFQRGGHGSHCYGYYNDDRTIAFCTETPNGLGLPNSAGAYAHRLDQTTRAGDGSPSTAPRTASKRRVLYPNIRNKFPDGWHETARYPYHNADGTLRYYVVRYDPPTPSAGRKRYYPWQQLEGGQWVMDEQGIDRVLYRLPDLRTAPAHRTVFIPEGEKCADALAALGMVATCSSGGAKAWHQVPGAAEELRGRHAVILADNDADGRAYAAAVAEDLRGVAASVRILHLPGLAEHGDVYDWIDAGGTKDDLYGLAIATPAYDAAGVSNVEQAQATEDEPPADPITAATVTRLRARDAWGGHLQANPNIPNTLKPIIGLIKDEWNSGRARLGPNGSLRINRAIWSSKLNMSEASVTRQLAHVESAGLVQRAHDVTYEETTVIDGTGKESAVLLPRRHLSIVPTPKLLEQIKEASIVLPQRGGARMHCKHCGSEDVMIVCRTCGARYEVNQTGSTNEQNEQQATAQSQEISPAVTLKQSDRWGKHVPESKAIVNATNDADDARADSHTAGSEYVRTGELWSDAPAADDADSGERPADARTALLVSVRELAVEMNYPAVRIAGGRVTLAPTPAAWDAFLARADVNAIWALLEALETLETAAG